MALPLNLSGLLLAGGAGTRMGADKALVVVSGEPLVVRGVRTLAAVCDDVLVASGDGARLAGVLAGSGAREIADAPDGGGPLAGLVAGLCAARHALVAVLAVDHVAASAAVLRALADAWRGEPAIVPLVAGRPQPLHAVWSRTAATDLDARLRAGERGVTRAAAALGARLVGSDVWGEADPDARFAVNVNHPADLADFERHRAQGAP